MNHPGLWLCVGMAGLLAGCGPSGKASMNPVEWWRGLQGGAIAEQRPAPPGAEDPNPNLSSIPERPTPTDPKFREQLANSLIADRANARHGGGGVGDPSTAPALFGSGSLPPPGPAPAAPAAAPVTAQAAAPAQAAEAPPRVSRAPVGAVAEAPLAEPAPAQPDTSLPALPGAPPAAANLPGAPSSAPVPAAPVPAAPVSSAPVQEARAAAPEAAGSAAPVQVAFGAGSSALPRNAAPALRQLAARRGGSAIAVTGYGDATSGEPAAQSAALSLGLARGQAIANALIAAGVPANIIRVDAEASGRGGAARLVE